jgi:TonB-dependent starch-binding outer membrane protein SusC
MKFINEENWLPTKKNWAKKTIRVMRLTVILLFTGIAQLLAVNSYSQGTKMTLECSNQPIKEVLKLIENQSEFLFLYNSKIVDVERKVNIQVKNQEIETILNLLFAGSGVTHKLIDRQIVLSPIAFTNNDSQQQEKKISGKVVDQKGEPLPGVSVVIKGTNLGILTDNNGVFSMTVPGNAKTLSFTFVGMTPIDLEIGNEAVFNISMLESSIGLEEVVVIGYGTVKKSSLTAAVATLKNEKLNQIAVGRADLAIVGQLPGISIKQTSTRPGDAPVVRIRGISSITGLNDPLYVVDGVPIIGDLNSINSGDIESIEVLKDASSAAIYGSRAAAGVVLITTKRGTGLKPTFNLNTYVGVRTPTNLVDDYHNAREAFDYAVKVSDSNWRLAGGDPAIPIYDRPLQYRPDSLYLKLGDTDWQKELLRNALMQNYELSSNGGTDRIKYYISANYMDEQSTYIVGEYKRYSARTNVDVKISDKFNLGITFSPAYSTQRRTTAVMGDMTKFPPYIPIFLPDGRIAKDGSHYAGTLDFFTNPYIKGKNPVAQSLGTKDMYYRFNGFGNIFLDYEIIKNLKFRTSVAFDYQTVKNPYFVTTFANKDSKTEANFDYGENLNSLNENLLSYNNTFNQHSVDVIAGSTFQKNKNFLLSMTVPTGSIPNDKIETLNAGIVNGGSTFMSEWGLVSFFGRVNYGFADKYLLSISYRKDGSSRFGEDRKWGSFPAASVAWRINKESFMENQKLFSNMKLRLSYGLTGRTPVGLYDQIPRIQNYTYSLGSGNGVKVAGATQGTFGNSELGWEKTKEFNFGVDLGILKDRISVESDFYHRLTTDLLLNNPIPGITGFVSTTTNLGKVSNTGVELSFNSRNLVGALKWETRINYTKNINEVVSLGELNSLPLATSKKGMWFLTEVGNPIGLFYGYKQTGVWQSQAELDANPHFAGSIPGSIRVEDVSKDGIIDQDDRTILGSYMPDFEFGITNNLSYKNFDLSVLVNGVIGFDVWNMELSYYRENRLYVTDTQWYSEENPGNGQTPSNREGIDPRDTDFYIEDGSYWSVRNLTLGYTMDKDIFKKVFTSARFYLSAQNLYIHLKKGFHAYNPEGLTDYESEATRPGVNFGSEPLNRTITMGISLGF